MKTSLTKYYKTDENLEKDGSWYESESGASFLIRRFGGKNSVKINEARAKHFMSKIKDLADDKLPEEDQLKLFVKVFVEACVCDWSLVHDEDGNVIDYDPKLAEDVLNDCPELFEELLEFSQNRNKFKKVADLGNS